LYARYNLLRGYFAAQMTTRSTSSEAGYYTVTPPLVKAVGQALDGGPVSPRSGGEPRRSNGKPQPFDDTVLQVVTRWLSGTPGSAGHGGEKLPGPAALKQLISTL
jgi:hypothetical protein